MPIGANNTMEHIWLVEVDNSHLHPSSSAFKKRYMVKAFCPLHRKRPTEELTPGSWNMSQKHFNDPDTGEIPANTVRILEPGPWKQTP